MSAVLDTQSWPGLVVLKRVIYCAVRLVRVWDGIRRVRCSSRCAIRLQFSYREFLMGFFTAITSLKYLVMEF